MEEFKSLFEGVNNKGFVLATDCIVCGETITTSDACNVPRMCEKCKAAVMAMRKQMEADEQMENYLMLNGKRIDLTAEQIETLVGKKEKDPFERVESHNVYYFVDSDGKVECETDENLTFDNDRYEAGNYCTDEELMKQRRLHETLNRLLWRYSMQNNGGVIVPRFYIYRCDDGRYQIGSHPHCRVNGVTYFDVVATAEDAIEEIVKPFMEKHPELRW